MKTGVRISRAGMMLMLLGTLAVTAGAQTSLPTAPAPLQRPAYVLDVDDQITVQVQDLDEIKGDRPIRIDMQGNVRLPIVGRLHVAGLTVEEVEAELTKRLGSVLKEPEVTVLVAEFRSHPVSVLGWVKNPGVVQLTGKKNLSEVLSMAGGANPDAGNTIVITRKKEAGPLPLPDAHPDPSGLYFIGEVNLKSLMEASNPRDNIAIESGDVITVPKGQLIYVLGAVQRQGGFVLNERENITVLQAITMAGGLDRFANQRSVEILRPKPGTNERAEIFVDVKAMLAAKTAMNASDVPLQANDLLYVPISGKKAATVRAIEAMIGAGTAIGTGLAIYRQ
jgi:polysaccharide export outer membrane protein